MVKFFITCLYCGHLKRVWVYNSKDVTESLEPCIVCGEKKKFKIIKLLDTYNKLEEDDKDDDGGWESFT